MSKPISVLRFSSLINFGLRKKFSPLPQYMYFETKNLAPVALNVIIGSSLTFRNVISMTAAFFAHRSFF